MMIDLTDYMNGVTGIFEAFEYDQKYPGYWCVLDMENNLKLHRWKRIEPHLYSWHLGRKAALTAILDYFEALETEE